jgi:outer membrane protein assembly factor BamD (BamD/ComL family)
MRPSQPATSAATTATPRFGLRALPLLAAAALLTGLLIPSVASADRDPSELAKAALATAQEKMAAREWDAAAIAFADVAKNHAGTPEAEQARIFQGRTLLLAGRMPDAILVFQDYVDAHPTGAWVDAARYGIADALIASKDYGSAAEIYRARTAFYASEGWKQRIAAAYLDIADRAFRSLHG